MNSPWGAMQTSGMTGGDEWLGNTPYRKGTGEVGTDIAQTDKEGKLLGGYMSDEVKPGHVLVTPRGVIYSKADAENFLRNSGLGSQSSKFKEWGDPDHPTLINPKTPEQKEKDRKAKEIERQVTLVGMPALNLNLTTLSDNISALAFMMDDLHGDMAEFQGMKGIIQLVQKVAGMANVNAAGVESLRVAVNSGKKPREMAPSERPESNTGTGVGLSPSGGL